MFQSGVRRSKPHWVDTQLARLLEPTLLQVAQTPDLWVIVYTPLPGTDTGAKLQGVVVTTTPSE